MAKAKERLDAEAKLNMTKMQKLDNFWFYHKIHIILSICGVCIVGMMIYDIVTQVDNDYTIGLVSPKYLSPELLIGMEDAIQSIADDRNEDGNVVVGISHYQLSNDPSGDPMTQMAATTRLSGDITAHQSMIYIIDNPDFYTNILEGMFSYNDGSQVIQGEPVDVENLGFAMGDIALFDQIVQIDQLADLRVIMVNDDIPAIQEKEEKASYYNDSKLIYNQLKGE